jgi:hypothetical protein
MINRSTKNEPLNSIVGSTVEYIASVPMAYGRKMRTHLNSSSRETECSTLIHTRKGSVGTRRINLVMKDPCHVVTREWYLGV